MHFNSYDYITGQLLGTFPKLNFGDMIQNQHCASPLLLKAFPDQETNVQNLLFYLVNKGPWKDTEFGFYTQSSFMIIEAGSSLFVHLIESGAGTPVNWNGTSSDFIWLDSHIHNVTGFIEADFRLLFDHN